MTINKKLDEFLVEKMTTGEKFTRAEIEEYIGSVFISPCYSVSDHLENLERIGIVEYVGDKNYIYKAGEEKEINEEKNVDERL